jgi:hypothetical protein
MLRGSSLGADGCLSGGRSQSDTLGVPQSGLEVESTARSVVVRVSALALGGSCKRLGSGEVPAPPEPPEHVAATMSPILNT